MSRRGEQMNDRSVRAMLGPELWTNLLPIMRRTGEPAWVALQQCIVEKASRLHLRSDSRLRVAIADANDAMPRTAAEAMVRYQLLAQVGSAEMATLLNVPLATYRKYRNGALRVPVETMVQARLVARRVVPGVDPVAAHLMGLLGLRPRWDGRGRKRVPVEAEGPEAIPEADLPVEEAADDADVATWPADLRPSDCETIGQISARHAADVLSIRYGHNHSLNPIEHHGMLSLQRGRMGVKLAAQRGAWVPLGVEIDRIRLFNGRVLWRRARP